MALETIIKTVFGQIKNIGKLVPKPLNNTALQKAKAIKVEAKLLDIINKHQGELDAKVVYEDGRIKRIDFTND